MAHVYKITNQINGKVYIGKTVGTIEKRWHEHQLDSKHTDQRRNRPFYRALNKYGFNNFIVEEIEECSAEEVNEREIYWIDYYRSYVGWEDCNGYNATIGGDGKVLYDHEAILKRLLEYPFAKQVAEEFGCCRDIVSDIAKENNIDLITPLLQRNREELRKRISVFDKANNYIETFESTVEAAEWVYRQGKCLTLNSGVRGHVAEAANGKRKTAYSYIWKYE